MESPREGGDPVWTLNRVPKPKGRSVLASALARIAARAVGDPARHPYAGPAVPTAFRSRGDVVPPRRTQHTAPETTGTDSRASHTAPATPPKDRRAHPRRQSGCVVSICRKPEQGSLTAQQIDWQLHSGELRGQLLDVSISGVAFRLNNPLTVQEEVFLRLLQRNFEKGLDVQGRVVHVETREPGEWIIHCRLRQRLALEQVQQFGRQLFASDIV